MLQQTLGITSAVLIIIAAIPYYLSIFRGRSKPQRMAMFIFLVLSLISFSGQWAEGATASLWFAGFLVLNQVINVGLSFKYGMGGHSKLDIFSIFSAGMILLLWYLTSSAALAIILVVSINFIAKVLVAHKVYYNPKTELLYSWALSAVASMFAVFSVGELDWILILPPLHNAITVSVISLILYARGNKSFNHMH